MLNQPLKECNKQTLKLMQIKRESSYCTYSSALQSKASKALAWVVSKVVCICIPFVVLDTPIFVKMNKKKQLFLTYFCMHASARAYFKFCLYNSSGLPKKRILAHSKISHSRQKNVGNSHILELLFFWQIAKKKKPFFKVSKYPFPLLPK